MSEKIQIKYLSNYNRRDWGELKKAYPDDSGYDLRAAIKDDGRPLVLTQGDRMLIPTGILLAVPVGYEAQIRPRSGKAYNFGLTVLNTPGTIDAGYRGEVGIILANLGHHAVKIMRGDKVAQLVFCPIATLELEHLTAKDKLPLSERDKGGFGSTG